MSTSIFDGMNRKSKREFKKLPDDKKIDMFQTAIVQKVSGVMSTEIAKAMINGIYQEREKLYKDYVEKIDSSEDFEEKSDIIEKLLSYLRVEHLKNEQRKNEEAQNKKES